MASATLGPAKVPEKGTSGRLASLSGSSPRIVPVIMPFFFRREVVLPTFLSIGFIGRLAVGECLPCSVKA